METLQNSQIDRQQVIDRLAKLDSARAQLKQEFIGIDRVIDELMDSISTWYTLPELQTRPLVVNLWGMTGTGKTSLIKRLAELIDRCDASYLLDLSNASDSYSFFETMNDIFSQNNGRSFILTLDEFQHARTITETGEERTFGKMGNIWRILDTGMFEVYAASDYYLKAVAKLIAKLQVCIANGVTVERGMVTAGMAEYVRIMGYADEVVRDKKTGIAKLKARKKLPNETMFIPQDDLWDIVCLVKGQFSSDTLLRDHLLGLNSDETMDFLERALNIGKKPEICDCRKALVIVAGNLDEAYRMAKDVNPDIPAEVWKKLVRDIGINEVKSALRKRFRPEHIGRLGNNHIIYPAMGERDFRRFIAAILKDISGNFNRQHSISLTFSNALHRLIYAEGVFPTQGFRPVISTIDQMVRSRVSTAVGHVLVSYPETTEVQMGIRSGKMELRFISGKRLLGKETYTLKLNLSERRKLKKDDEHALISVHEAGHAVCGSLLLGEVPEVAVSVTTNRDEGGFVIRSGEDGLIQRSRLIRIAACLLGGYVAEKLVFGEDGLTNGSTSDLKKVTELVRGTLEKAGMDNGPVAYQSVKGFDYRHVVDHSGLMDRLTENLLKEAEEMARKVLEEERQLLLTMAEGLFQHGSLTKTEMQRMVDAHARRNAEERKDDKRYKERFMSELATLRTLQKVA